MKLAILAILTGVLVMAVVSLFRGGKADQGRVEASSASLEPAAVEQPRPRPIPALRPAPVQPAPLAPPDAGMPLDATSKPSLTERVMALYRPTRIEGGKMSRPLIAHDPLLAEMFYAQGTGGRRHYLSVAGEIPRCGREYVARKEVPRWTFDGAVNVELEISDGWIRFTDIAFDATPEPVVDEEFVECYSREVKRFQIRCERCRPGRVRLQWNLNKNVFGPGISSDYGPNWMNPKTDETFRIHDDQ